MDREQSTGTCEHCQQQFGYYLVHSGFNDSVYAYCDSCGKTASLSLLNKRMPKLRDCPRYQEMCSAMEPYVQPCGCGGSFKKGSAPRCPYCNKPLSPELATTYIESNAPGAWRWQRNWSGLYCIVIQNKWIADNFR